MPARTIQRPLVTCFGDVDLVHASHPVTGLIELADAGEIDLRFRFQDRGVSGFRGAWTLWMHVDAGNGSLPVAIDLHDGADYVSAASLRNCHRYYKVNLSNKTYAVAAAEHHDRLRPYGPYFPCRPRRDRALFRRWLANLAVKAQHRFLYAVRQTSWEEKRRELASETRRHRRYLGRKIWTDYESPPQSTDLPSSVILFNPTCWDESESKDVRMLNEFRAELIVALRREFGEQFIGGFRNVGSSVGRYPAALETHVLSHEQYVNHLQTSAIVVYSNGKSGCFSWRFGEAFAASKCIVSEPIPNDAGIPLDEHVGCTQVAGIADMVATLRRLLSERDAVAEFSRRANAYYLEHIRPPVRMRLLLDEVLGRQPTAASAATPETFTTA